MGIIKHKKDQYVDLLKKNDIQEELSLHHDFNPSTTAMIIGVHLAVIILLITSGSTLNIFILL